MIKVLSNVDYGAGKHLKPYQGLKPSGNSSCRLLEIRAGKHLKPYQGLKRMLVALRIGAGFNKPENT